MQPDGNTPYERDKDREYGGDSAELFEIAFWKAVAAMPHKLQATLL